MKFDWDLEKDEATQRERGVGFEQAKLILLADGTLRFPARHVGEDRWIALGEMDGKLWSVCYTERGDVTRIISFRRANEKEQVWYEQAR